jgi:hypothetical protein
MGWGRGGTHLIAETTILASPQLLIHDADLFANGCSGEVSGFADQQRVLYWDYTGIIRANTIEIICAKVIS